MSVEKVDSEPNSIGDNLPIPPRENLVKTAAKFLSSPNVVKAPLETKVAFLKKKGLSDAEIDLAIKQSEVIIQSRSFENSRIPNSTLQPYIPPWPPQSRWAKYRDITNTVALLAGLAYAVYWFYKKYIAPFLFGSKDRKSLDARLAERDSTMLESLTELKNCVSELREELGPLSTRKGPSISKQIEELKGEVSSLKKLLLNRKQFPPSTVTAPLSIPVWQIAATSEEKEVEEEGVGSGTNGSDSSLEMIKE
uniref:Peroxisomal membrane protein PEX14 n=2 Tax=Rhodnius TaxID=13248 RepID=A0A4P6D6U4_RHOPR